MNSVFICFTVAVISLQILIGDAATDAQRYKKAQSETKKLWAEGEKLRDFIQKQSKLIGVIISAGVKSGDQYIRAFTSVQLANGELAYGTNLTDPGTIELLNAGLSAKKDAIVFGQRYLTYVLPVLDESNKVIGFYGAGVPANFISDAAIDTIKYKKAKLVTKKLWAVGEKLRDFIQKQSKLIGVIISAGVKSGDQYIRAFTSVQLANGELAYGTSLTDQSTIELLNAGQPAKREAMIFGQRYFTYVLPVLDKSKNKVIGFYGAGVPAKK